MNSKQRPEILQHITAISIAKSMRMTIHGRQVQFYEIHYHDCRLLVLLA